MSKTLDVPLLEAEMPARFPRRVAKMYIYSLAETNGLR